MSWYTTIAESCVIVSALMYLALFVSAFLVDIKENELMMLFADLSTTSATPSRIEALCGMSIFFLVFGFAGSLAWPLTLVGFSYIVVKEC